MVTKTAADTRERILEAAAALLQALSRSRLSFFRWAAVLPFRALKKWA